MNFSSFFHKFNVLNCHRDFQRCSQLVFWVFFSHQRGLVFQKQVTWRFNILRKPGYAALYGYVFQLLLKCFGEGVGRVFRVNSPSPAILVFFFFHNYSQTDVQHREAWWALCVPAPLCGTSYVEFSAAWQSPHGRSTATGQYNWSCCGNTSNNNLWLALASCTTRITV